MVDPAPSSSSADLPSALVSYLSAALGHDQCRRSLKTHMSIPGLQSPSADAPSLPARPDGPVSTPGSPDSLALAPLVAQANRPQALYRLAEPRLSPMEYARSYLLDKARAEKEGRACRLPPPDKLWCWTDHNDGFLLLPKVPAGISRDLTKADPAAEAGSSASSSSESVATAKQSMRSTPCPRLSLNLGGMTALFPALTNLGRLGMSRRPYPLPTLRFQGAPHVLRPRRISMSLTRAADEVQSDDMARGEPLTLAAILGSARDDPGSSGQVPEGRDQREGPERQTHLPEAQSLHVQDVQGVAREPSRLGPTADEASHVCCQGNSVRGAHVMAGPGGTEASSLYSEGSSPKSVIREAPVGLPGSTAATPSHSLRGGPRAKLTPSRSTLLSLALDRPVVEYSPALFISPSPTAPLARAPGLVPSRGTRPAPTRARGLATGSGNHDNGQDGSGLSQRAGLAYSTSSNRAGGSRPVETALADLQPAPLTVRKQRAPPRPREAERCSRMWQGLSDEIGAKMAELGRLGDDSKLDDDELLQRSARGGPLTESMEIKVRHMSLENVLGPAKDTWEPWAAKPPQPQMQRTASAVFATGGGGAGPSIRPAPSFTIADRQEPSGFTPRRRRPGAVVATLPDSPTLPSRATFFDRGQEAAVSGSRTQQELKTESGLGASRSVFASSDRVRPLDGKIRIPVPKPSRGVLGAGPPSSLGTKPRTFALDESKGQGSVTLLPKLGTEGR